MGQAFLLDTTKIHTLSSMDLRQASQSSVSASSAQPSSGSVPASAGSAQAVAPVAAAPTQAGGVPNAAAPASAQAAAPSVYGKDEAEQIKSILTQSFGEGIKFEELPE